MTAATSGCAKRRFGMNDLASLDGGVASVHPKIIGNFTVVIHIEDGNVSNFTNFKGADLFVAAERIRGIDGRSGNSFGWSHTQLGARQRQNHRHAYGWAGAGII